MNLATQILLYGKPFRITDFFRMGQVGWHWQIDDPLKRVGIPYEWVDTAGTTPTTAVGQGIGLLLGREYGGATGPSLLANGATGLTGTATAASYSTTTFAGSVSRAGDASNQSWVTWTGLTTSAVHRIRITNTGATSLDVRNGGVAGTIVASIAAGASSWVHPATTGGSTSITITATANSTTATFTLGQFAVLPGTHLTQATGTAKPTLSARVNLLLASEDFSSASWNKFNGGTGAAPVVTVNAATAPNGTLTADKIDFSIGAGTTTSDYSIIQQSVSLTGTHKGMLWIKADSPVRIMLRTGSTWLAVDATTTWQSFTPPQEASSSLQFGLRAGYGIASLPTSASVYVWGADLRTADDAAKNLPAYQRVGATATDHDTDGFPHYALADGTDDCWASVGTVDGSGSNKVTVVAAVTKNSDAALGIVLELTTSLATQNASFAISAPDSAAANYGIYTRGSSATGFSATTFAAPVTSVVGAKMDNGGAARATQIFPQVNGVTPTLTGESNPAAGAGNYANATLYVLSRAGTTSRFNGRFYGSTGRFGPMGDSERNNLTRWWMKRIGTA